MIWPVNPLVVEIERAPTETLGSGADAREKNRPVFRNGVKPMPLNMTNWDAVAVIAGDDTDDWAGHRVELYPTTTELKGKVVDCATASVYRSRGSASRRWGRRCHRRTKIRMTTWTMVSRSEGGAP